MSTQRDPQPPDLQSSNPYPQLRDPDDWLKGHLIYDPISGFIGAVLTTPNGLRAYTGAFKLPPQILETTLPTEKE